MPNKLPYVNIDLEEITARNDNTQHIIAGFATATPALADIWRYLQNAFSDVPTLAAEITRLAAELQNTRLDRSNLLAAARATIAAYHDGESEAVVCLLFGFLLAATTAGPDIHSLITGFIQWLTKS
jgi:hypothetical protein